MADMYKPDKLKEDAAQKKMLIDTAVDVQVILQILIEKEIITKEELDIWRNRVKQFPKYKASYEMISKMLQAADIYEKNPQEYLRLIMDAKLKGWIN